MRWTLGSVLVGFVVGCGDEQQSDDDTAGRGGAAPTAGAAGAPVAGTRAGGTGGAEQAGNGGDTSTGGATTGGVPGAGSAGKSASGGASTGGAGATSGGTGGTSQAGASGTPVVDGALGSACEADEDCSAGLDCLTAATTSLPHGGPAGGMCTKRCEFDGSTCGTLDAAASCVALDGVTGYCLEGCTLGAPAAGVVKCHDRSDAACTMVYDYESRAGACQTDDDCESGFDCSDGSCIRARTACVPHCVTNADCGPGLHCDYSEPFELMGVCTAAAPVGLGSGEPCVGSGDCMGACFPLSGDVSACLSGCTYDVTSAACGEPGSSQKGSGCLLPVTEVSGRGDAALCVPLCDCNDDCNNPGLYCLPFSEGSAAGERYGRAGYCYVGQASDGIACPGR